MTAPADAPRPPPVREPDRPPRGGWTTTRWAWLAALPVVVVAATVLAHRAWPKGSKGSPAGVPDEFHYALVGIVVVWIAAVVPRGLVDRAAAWRRDRAGRLIADEPWIWDHRWDPKGESRTPFSRLAKNVAPPAAPLFVVAILAAQWAALSPPGDRWIFWPPVGALTAFLAWRAWRVFGGGTSHVTYAKFPFHPGERVTLWFGTSGGGASFERVAFFLRRVREEHGRDVASKHVVYRTFELEEHRPPGLLPGPDQDVEISFDLPADVGATRLSSSLPRYWTLDVYGHTSAGPYRETFLVPIYERPGTSDV